MGRHLIDRTDRAFATLKGNGQYRWYFLGSFMLSMGFWIQNTAQAWLVLELIHSASMVAILILYEFGPRAAFGLFGGVVVDRYDERLVLLWSHAGLMLCAAALAVPAAGSTNSAVRISPLRMVELVDAAWVDVCQSGS